jgi:hypothetical protein
MNWALGIIAALVVAGGVATFSMLFTMRDQLSIIAARPEPASREQVSYLQKQVDDLRAQVEQVKNERR